jgi:hypothetical protein
VTVDRLLYFFDWSSSLNQDPSLALCRIKTKLPSEVTIAGKGIYASVRIGLGKLRAALRGGSRYSERRYSENRYSESRCSEGRYSQNRYSESRYCEGRYFQSRYYFRLVDSRLHAVGQFAGRLRRTVRRGRYHHVNSFVRSGKSSMHDFLGHNSGRLRVNATPDRPLDQAVRRTVRLSAVKQIKAKQG